MRNHANARFQLASLWKKRNEISLVWYSMSLPRFLFLLPLSQTKTEAQKGLYQECGHLKDSRNPSGTLLPFI